MTKKDKYLLKAAALWYGSLIFVGLIFLIIYCFPILFFILFFGVVLWGLFVAPIYGIARDMETTDNFEESLKRLERITKGNKKHDK